jgi:hypothetical protein
MTAGSYTVTVSAPGYNPKTSDPVTVNNIPNLSGDITITDGTDLVTAVAVNTPLTADYDGSESGLSYQWYKDGAAINLGGTEATYTPTETGSYTVTVSAPGYNPKTSAAVIVYARTDASIKTTFGISTTNTQGVTDTFNAVHAYLQSKTAAEVANEGLIQEGDYIDLPSITVTGGTPNPTVNDAELTGHGRLLRLIVVGINSFNAQGAYTGNGNGAAAHLVFQFQNVAFTHRMNASNDNTGGYALSEMRTWLTGAFLTGLTNAGVPSGVLWAPKRYVSKGGNPSPGADEINTDTLWLPTERELFGSRSLSNDTDETAANQARLAYYTNNDRRIKYNNGNTAAWYWEASPGSASAANFCLVNLSGFAGYYDASAVGGCAPAFCVR